MKIRSVGVSRIRLLATAALLLGAQVFAIAQSDSSAAPTAAASSPLDVTAAPVAAAAHPQIVADYGKLPLQFERNAGQADGAVQYLARGPGYALFLTADETVLTLPGKSSPESKGRDAAPSVLRMSLVGAKAERHLQGKDLQSGRSDYFIGRDASRWHTDVARFGKVESPNVYPGIDLVYYGNQQQLEYDFVVAPRANPAAIRLKFDGAEDLAVNGEGDLVVKTRAGELVQHKPVVYQQVGDKRVPREGRYVLHRNHEASIQVASYDPSQTLVIDPTLVYSTYLNGDSVNGGSATSLAVDAAGNTYIAGDVYIYHADCCNPTFDYNFFVNKISADGQTLIYAATFGGSGYDFVRGIKADGAGNVYLVGRTCSADFPVHAALQPNLSGGCDAFVAKLNPGGNALIYSTYLGGSAGTGFGYLVGGADSSFFNEAGYAIAVDSAGSAYVAGSTQSRDFPTTPGAVQSTYSNGSSAFVSKLAPDGGSLVYSTYYANFVGNGASAATAIALDGMGRAFITGVSTADGTSTAGFIARFSADGSAATQTSFTNPADYYPNSPHGIAVDGAGNSYVTGDTDGFTAGCTDESHDIRVAFVYKYGPDLSSAPLYSRYLCGEGGLSDPDQSAIFSNGAAITVDGSGNAYVTGSTRYGNFPLVDPIQSYNASRGSFSFYDAFITKLSPDGSTLLFSTYLGGNDDDNGVGIALDGAGDIYVAGSTYSGNLLLRNALQRTPGGSFLAKISPAPSVCNTGTLTFTAAAYNVNENRGVATIGVRRVGGTCSTAYAFFGTGSGTARSGTNYRGVRTILDWNDGDGSVKTFTVPIFDDGRFNTTLNVQLGLVGGFYGAGLGPIAGAQLNIVNVDPRPTVALRTGDRTVRAPTTVTLLASLSAVSGLDTKVAFGFSGSAVKGVDYRLSDTSILIPAGQQSGRLTIEIPAGAAASGPKTLTATIRGASGATPSGVLSNTLTIRTP